MASASGVRERVAVAGDLEYRIAGHRGIVVVTLRPGEGLLAEPGGLLYRRGAVGWSLAATGRNVLGQFLNRAMRRAAGASSLMDRYEGPGELALATAPPCRLIATRLEPGYNLVVERLCRCHGGRGVLPGARRRGEAGRVVLMRLTGADVAFLQAAESSTELELAPGEELEAPVATVVCFEATVEYELRLARIGVGLGRRAGVEWMAGLTGPGRAATRPGNVAALEGGRLPPRLAGGPARRPGGRVGRRLGSVASLRPPPRPQRQRRARAAGVRPRLRLRLLPLLASRRFPQDHGLQGPLDAQGAPGRTRHSPG